MLLNKVKEMFRTNFMKQRLFKLIKKEGQFVRFDKDFGYIYRLSLGEGNCIQLEVAFKDLQSLQILNAAAIRQQIA
jgi:hypothetical protein